MPASGPQLPQHLALPQPQGVSRLLLFLAGCQAPEAVAALPSLGHCLLRRVWQERAPGEALLECPPSEGDTREPVLGQDPQLTRWRAHCRSGLHAGL